MKFLVAFAAIVAVAAAQYEPVTIVQGAKSTHIGPSGTVVADSGSIVKSESMVVPKPVLPTSYVAPVVSAPVVPTTYSYVAPVSSPVVPTTYSYVAPVVSPSVVSTPYVAPVVANPWDAIPLPYYGYYV